MATPIPAFVSQWFPSVDAGIRDDSGSNGNVLLSDIAGSIWFYLASNRTTFSNGMSLLKCVELALIQSTGGGAGTWTVRLSATSPFRVSMTNNTGVGTTIALLGNLGDALGYNQDGTNIPNGTAATITKASPLMWTPNMPVSMTGPQIFDPAVSYGVPTSAGAVQRAPDMTAAAVSNGTQWAAEYRFNGVDGYYKARAPGGATHLGEDFETWWQNGPALGRRLLMWRDRTNITGSSAPSAGGSSPYNYVEYFPTDELRGQLLAQPMAPPNLNFWDIRVPLLVTENGESVLTV